MTRSCSWECGLRYGICYWQVKFSRADKGDPNGSPLCYNGAMNIFYLDETPKLCAEMHCDKHVVKMITEYAQLMSSAHRVIDGKLTDVVLPNHKVKKIYLMPGESTQVDVDYEDGDVGFLNPRYKLRPANRSFYAATHINHPCTVWTRSSQLNYYWLFETFSWLLKEYTHRYSRQHACQKLVNSLQNIPSIEKAEFTPPPAAMPPEYKVPGDEVQSYRNFYMGEKSRFAKWTKRPTPTWFKTHDT